MENAICTSDAIYNSLQGLKLNKQDILMLLSAAAGDETERLFTAANQVRDACAGSDVLLRGILEISNICERNCLYCGLRKDNGKIIRYRMQDDEITASARQIRAAGVGTMVLQSGEDSFLTAAKVCRLIEIIKKETALTITLSLGERPYQDYKAFKEAGADRYLLKHETADPDLYRRLRPGSHLEDRLQSIRRLKELGFETGTGNMVGLPGQTVASLAEDIIIMKEYGADMIGIGPFIAHPDTPLGHFPSGDPELVFKVLAVARLVTRTTNIPATTALGTIDPRHRIKALMVGANVVMPDFTPDRYKKHYDIYPGKSRTEYTAARFLEQLARDITPLDRRLGINLYEKQYL
ncbi:MAG: [FeFe] hydrogenase H-cluster radical SAM maturase HydE [Syntrophus sp. (in: bacteria)]|nr:[FeFe] hydrogenase H-cluster radical SAM maturase HydE [Syntrophus sp. (in: bacteria)]